MARPLCRWAQVLVEGLLALSTKGPRCCLRHARKLRQDGPTPLQSRSRTTCQATLGLRTAAAVVPTDHQSPRLAGVRSHTACQRGTNLVVEVQGRLHATLVGMASGLTQGSCQKNEDGKGKKCTATASVKDRAEHGYPEVGRWKDPRGTSLVVSGRFLFFGTAFIGNWAAAVQRDSAGSSIHIHCARMRLVRKAFVRQGTSPDVGP